AGLLLSHSIPFISFSSTCRRDHPALHSFPTRRSSDLTGRGRRGHRAGRGDRPILCRECGRQGNRVRALLGPARTRRRLGPRGGRSEEHTSELQSRENLVCRLLLEKKKNNVTKTARTSN